MGQETSSRSKSQSHEQIAYWSLSTLFCYFSFALLFLTTYFSFSSSLFSSNFSSILSTYRPPLLLYLRHIIRSTCFPDLDLRCLHTLIIVVLLQQSTLQRVKRQAEETEAEFRQKQEKMKNELNAEVSKSFFLSLSLSLSCVNSTTMCRYFIV